MASLPFRKTREGEARAQGILQTLTLEHQQRPQDQDEGLSHGKQTRGWYHRDLARATAAESASRFPALSLFITSLIY